ncbi:zinc finger protein 605-like [Thrips palmi]|uniref:Zinc finger protein 605-like n=1 Tax=Thrips palmi TaxID=161013 RepID=A0A6P8Z9D4_THRPL|nr:zinc finger protein 605-like [Thrips palmi]
MSEKPPDSNCCSSCDSKATLVRSASGHFLKRIGCIEKSDRTENCIGVSERLDAKQKVKGSCDTGTPTQQVGYSLLLQRRDCRKMDPYVLIRGLKFPRDYSPSKISDSEAPRRRKAGIVPKLYGRLTCGKSVIAYVCHHCNKIFTNQLAIQNHVRNECECFKNVLKCELCDKIFTGSDLHNYVLHKELKHSMRCSVCSKSFITERRLVLHRRSQHPEIKFYYQCDLCRKGFKTKPKLLEHYKDHRRQEASEVTKLKQYRCSYCRQVCFGFKKLTAHYREHQTEKRLAEEETRRLSAYDKVRKRRKRKKSDVSIRNFPTVGTLPFEGRKIYVCYLCNIYFNEACELRDHMENHVDGVCMKCHIDFSTSADLKIHQNLIHYYKCKTCYLTFVKKSHRKNHKISCKGVKNGIKL